MCRGRPLSSFAGRLACRGGARRALSAGFLCFAHRPHRLLASLARDAVEDQDTVEVVDLMLDDPRLEALRLNLDPISGEELQAIAEKEGLNFPDTNSMAWNSPRPRTFPT